MMTVPTLKMRLRLREQNDLPMATWDVRPVLSGSSSGLSGFGLLPLPASPQGSSPSHLLRLLIFFILGAFILVG